MNAQNETKADRSTGLDHKRGCDQRKRGTLYRQGYKRYAKHRTQLRRRAATTAPSLMARSALGGRYGTSSSVDDSSIVGSIVVSHSNGIHSLRPPKTKASYSGADERHRRSVAFMQHCGDGPNQIVDRVEIRHRGRVAEGGDVVFCHKAFNCLRRNRDVSRDLDRTAKQPDRSMNASQIRIC